MPEPLTVIRTLVRDHHYGRVFDVEIIIDPEKLRPLIQKAIYGTPAKPGLCKVTDAHGGVVITAEERKAKT